MAIAELRLFGGFELRCADGEVIDLPGQKDRALIAILALRSGASQSRDKLASLLWSDRGDKQARDSLKHSLNRLRLSFCSATSTMIVADRHSVALDPTTVTADVAAFEQLLSDGTPETLEQAVALYQGDLLDGFVIQDPSFEDWLVGERQRLRNSVEQALTNLMEQSTVTGAKDRAAKAARRLLLLDPLREAACRTLMQIEADHGQTSQALKIYETLRNKLHRELGVKPEPATTQLYETIRLRRAVVTLPASGPTPTEPAAAVGTMLAQFSLPPKRPIAVLPFQNLSGDPEQEYFADGITEDIIIDLSKVSTLNVLSRRTTFTFKGKAVEVSQIAKQLGVGYVVEGSVRKAGDRVRITAQLIDAHEDRHLWAERYDRDLSDIFALQDEISRAIVSALKVKLLPQEKEAIENRSTQNPEAYRLYLLARYYRAQYTARFQEIAFRFCQRALEIDPNYARAWVLFGLCQASLHQRGRSKESGLVAAEKALSLD
jgi:TolB-like protein/DNA-binding SARP family transcriptional activator